MSMKKTRRLPRLTPQRRYEQREVVLEHCPYCQNDRIGKTPRRKGGPSMFHCRKCGYMTNIDLMYDMYRLLGQVPA